MFELRITMTGKGYSPKDKFQCFDTERKNGFASMREVYAYLQEQYGKAKRSAMYIDTKGKSIRCGWIIGFRADDICHVPVQKWIQQDWIELTKVETVDLDA